MLDVDGNGTLDPLTDGILALRYFSDFQSNSLIQGALAPDAIRVTDEEVVAHIESFLPIPRLRVFAPIVIEGDEGTTNALFTVVLSKASAQPVVVDYETPVLEVIPEGIGIPGGDYEVTTGTLSIPAGETVAAIAVPVLGNELVETDETFDLVFSNLQEAVFPQNLSTLTVSGTILNDDDAEPDSTIIPPMPGLIVDETGIPETVTEGQAAIFLVELATTSDSPISVTFSTRDGTAVAEEDYVAQSGTIQFQPGQSQALIAVETINDPYTEELEENFFLDVVTPDGVSLNPQSFSRTIVDDDQSSPGIVFHGAVEDGLAGSAVSGLGDINGDGIADIAIGAPGSIFSNSPGRTYIVFGGTDDSLTELDLSELNGSNGFVIEGIDPSDFSGIAVSDAGDVNGDGLNDLIIGAFGADANGDGSGESYVVFGRQEGFPATLNLSILDGINGFVINGANAGDIAGISVSTAGDFNNDGFADLIIGAGGADVDGKEFSGQSYLLFGGSSFSPSVELSSLDGSNGFAFNGESESSFVGISVDNIGDFNGDGFDDVIIGAPGDGASGERSYIVFGRQGSFLPTLTPADLDGTNGFTLTSSAFEFGFSVSGAGDINNDGLDDIIVGSNKADGEAGEDIDEAYVIFGSQEPLPATLDMLELDGSNGFVIYRSVTDDPSPLAVSDAGDINGDGIDDLLVGASDADARGLEDAGRSYVVFGQPGEFTPKLNLDELNGKDGLKINGIGEGDFSGATLSGVGDLNQDGLDDVIVGASGTDSQSKQDVGAATIIFGDTQFSEEFLLASVGRIDFGDSADTTSLEEEVSSFNQRIDENINFNSEPQSSSLLNLTGDATNQGKSVDVQERLRFRGRNIEFGDLFDDISDLKDSKKLQSNISYNDSVDLLGLFSFDWFLNSKFGPEFEIDIGDDFGEIDFEYPISFDLDFPDNLTAGQSFSFALGSDFKVDNASLQGEGFEGAGVSAKFLLESMSTGLENIVLKNPVDFLVDSEILFGPVDFPFPDFSVSPTIFDLKFGTGGEIVKFSDLAKIDYKAPTAIKAASQNGKSPGGGQLIDLSAEGQDFILNLEVDLDSFLEKLAFAFGTPIKFSVEEEFPPKDSPGKKVINASLKAELLDFIFNLGLGIRQDFIFKPKEIQTTVSTPNGSGESQELTLGNVVNLTVPENFDSDEFSFDVEYKLVGDVETQLFLVFQEQFKLDILQAEVDVNLFNLFKTKASIGPVLSPSQTGDLLEPIPIFSPFTSTLSEVEDGNDVFKIKETYRIPIENIGVSISDVSVKEDERVASFEVQLTEEHTDFLSIDFKTIGGSATIGEDFSNTLGSVRFFPGEPISKTIEVPIFDDELDEDTETFTVELTNPSAGLSLVDATATGTIIDNDTEEEEEEKPPEPPENQARSKGEPHLTTFDGVAYGFQGTGEYVYIESDVDDFVVQTRLESIRPNVSVATLVVQKTLETPKTCSS